MQNQLKYLVVPFLIFSLGCGVEFKDPQEEVAPAPRLKALNEISASYEGLKEPNKYNVVIAWPELDHFIRVSSAQQILETVPASEGKFVHSQQVGGSELSYVIEQLDESGKVLVTFPLTVTLPTDTYIDQAITLSESKVIEGARVFLGPNAVITTKDRSLTIIADEFISLGGTIQGFPKGSSAGREGNGRSAGALTINAKLASGELHLLLTGENGGPGRNGAITVPGRHPGCGGTNGGTGGNSSVVSINIDQGEDLLISTKVLPGEKGKGGRKGSVPMGSPKDVVNPPCHRDGGHGSDGRAGEKGLICIKLLGSAAPKCQ